MLFYLVELAEGREAVFLFGEDGNEEVVLFWKGQLLDYLDIGEGLYRKGEEIFGVETEHLFVCVAEWSAHYDFYL